MATVCPDCKGSGKWMCEEPCDKDTCIICEYAMYCLIGEKPPCPTCKGTGFQNDNKQPKPK